MMLISPWIDVTVSDPGSQTINDPVLNASEARPHGLLWVGDLDPADPRGVGCSCGAENRGPRLAGLSLRRCLRSCGVDRALDSNGTLVEQLHHLRHVMSRRRARRRAAQ